MALHTFTDDGYLGWTCRCGEEKTAHFSHAEVRYIHHVGTPLQRRTVALPLCACGTQYFLKVDFTPAELRAPNMIMPSAAGDGIPTPSYQVAQRHMQLAAWLDAHGKAIPVEEIAFSPSSQ